MLQHLENSNILDIYPLTPMQEGVYFHFLYDRYSPAFFVQLSYAIKGQIDLDLVRDSLALLTDRHHALRTVFNHEKKNTPLQIVLKKGNVDISFHEAQSDHQINELREQDSARQFDLNKDVLMRVSIIRTGTDQFEFIWSFHHILMDGWCINLLVSEYNVIYEGLRKGKEPSLPAIRPYRDYIQWLQGQDQQAAKRYWRDYLKDYSGTATLPSFNTPVKEGLLDNRQKIIRFDSPIVHRLRDISQSFGITVNLIIQAAWGILLGRYKGSNDAVFGVVVAGRPAALEGVESMIGLFINTIPVRVSFGNIPFSALLIKMQQDNLQRQDHSFISLSEIQSDTGLGKELLDHALVFEHFQETTTRQQNDPGPRESRKQHTQMRSAMVFEQSNYDLDVRIGFDSNEGIIGLKYNGYTFSDDMVSDVADYLYTLIERIAADVHTDCKDLVAITPKESAFLDAVGFKAVDFPMTATAVSIIESIAVNTGDRPALICAGDRQTYRELSQTANSIAHLIRSQGIASEEIVALLLPRGNWMPQSILGVWKAGCAYLPMDAEQPVDRLRWMLTDSRAKMLITDSDNLKKAQQLQWLCPDLHTLFCIDTNFFYSVPEGSRDTAGPAFWDYVGGAQVDDITAGGWINSYTGLPFSRAEMDEYVSNAVKKLSPHLSAASTVLEIGCGSGMTMFALAGMTRKYTGIDLSGALIAKNKQLAEERGLQNIDCYQMYAHEIHLLDKGGFDLIIINSVAQNFDGYNYLRGVISKCITLLKPQGLIFFGDIMDLDSQDELITTLTAFARADKDKAYQTRLDWTEELFIPRRFFDDLPAHYPPITRIEHSSKLHTLENELTKYRYDTFLFIDKTAAPAAQTPAKRQLDRTHLATFSSLPSIDRSHPGGLSYIIYTSGSTGNPKGVMVEHIGMLNHLYAKINDLSITADSRVLQNASATFDISVWQLFSALLAGGATYIYPQTLILNLSRFLDSLVKDKITIAEFVPSYLDALLEECSHSAIALPNLSFLLVTGEALSVDLTRRWFRLFPSIPVMNAYGPTEASDDITHHVMTVPPVTARVPLGKPVQNMRILILDKEGRQCPPGVRGEICVTGVGVGRGYVNNEAKTSLAFIANFIDPLSPYKIYRTGDSGCWLPDGTIEFYGREDYQVKIRGFRIELGEIECRLQELSGVRQAVVTARADAYGNKYLAAYVCFLDQASLTTDECKKGLHLKLPEYMVPEQFVFLDTLPLTPNGKVDRKNLPDPMIRNKTNTIELPLNDAEEKLRQIWEQVLDRRPISLHDNFFRIGGHSLKATRLATWILKEMKVKIELREIFEHPTLSELAACIARHELTTTDGITPSPVQEYYPVSHSQKRMWLLSQFREASMAYNVANSWVLRGDIQPDLLNKAMQLLVNRHEILRTTFTMTHNEPEQRIHTPGYFTNIFQYTDASTLADPQQFKTDWLNERENDVFDLETGPLIHLHLVRLSGQEYFCLLVLHHIICDGWSMQLIFNELTAYYSSLVLGSEPSPAALGIQYKDFAYWQTRQLEGKAFSGHREYWHSTLKGPLPSLRLPSLPRPQLQTYNGNGYIHSFSRSVSAGCRKLSEERQTSMFMTLVAMVNTLFYHYSGQKDILVGTSVAGRFFKELEDQIGFYINTLALRSTFSEKDTFDQLLAATKDRILGAFEHQLYPFDLIVDELSLERDLGRSAIFDVLIEVQNYQHTVADGGPGRKEAGFSAAPQAQTKTRSIFDLNLEFREYQDGLYLSMTYNTDIYSEAMVRRMALHLENLMKAICHEPAKQLMYYSFLDASEQKEILAFNPPPAALPEETAFSLFARQALGFPDRLAVKDKHGLKTYRELAVNARQIAELIMRTADATPLVGLLMDRSSLAVESILGIWQAGGAYLPLDPTIAPDQLREIAIRSKITILLTVRSCIRQANDLQWSSPHLHTIVCMDSFDIYGEKEPVLESMNREVWEMVGEKAEDDIMGGGWINSYTGKPFSRLEMDEYAENTYNKLKPFLTPTTRVLEIGCASGITLFRVAPETGYYLGTDLAGAILKKNTILAKERGLNHVFFQERYAHEIDQLEPGTFDIIIINSVIQNFSGTNYLRDVLDKCISRLSDQGIIYVGDIMDIQSRDIFLSDLAAHRSAQPNDNSAAHIDFSDHQFYSRIFFDDLRSTHTSIREVQHSQKQGTVSNELTRFRFDTILHIDKTANTGSHQPQKRQLDRRHLPVQDGLAPIDLSLPGGLAEARTTHRGLLNHILATREGMNIGEDTVLLQITPYTAGTFLWQLFAPLTTGASVRIHDGGEAFHAGAFLKSMLLEKARIAQVTPGQLSLIIEEARTHSVRLPDATLLGVTGDALPTYLAKHWYALFPHIDLMNMYGCAGASGTCCHSIVEREPGDQALPIGTPIRNTRIYVLNEARQLCPEGVIGEICIAGVGVEHLQEDPYPTGDRGRWLPGGQLSFNGRADQQVIIRGQQLDGSEIENRLGNAEGVKFAVVKDACAYISLFHGHTEEDTQTMQRRIKAVLPEYMAPDEIFLLDSLPLDKEGRIDRTALSGLQYKTQIKTTEAPRSLMEQQLATIWEEVLHRKPIGIYDNFFAMGGHSLKATRVISRVRKELFIKLELSQIFTAPTLAQLTEVVARSSRTKFHKIEPVPLQPDYALSHAQQRIWFLDRMEPDLIAYNMPSAYILTGELNSGALEQSFQWLVHRHEILRTSFLLKDGEPRQIVHAPDQSGFKVLRKDLRTSPDPMREAKDIYRTERQTPFDLEKGPLLRVQLLQVADFQYVLLYTVHHIVSDGWSMDLIVKELLRNYQQLLTDPAWSPTPLPIQYKDYSEWQNAELQGEATMMDKEYWLNKFKTTPVVLDMPSSYLRPPIKSYAGDTRQFMLPPALTLRLKQLSQEHGVSTYIMIVAIVNLLLHRYSGQEDIIISTPVAGRDHSDLDDQIGFYVNSLVLRTAVNGSWPFPIFLENVKQEVLQSFGHQFYPFDLLVEELELPRDMSRSPLFDVMVTYWEYNGVKPQANDAVRVEPLMGGSSVSKLDLTFHFMERANNMGVDIEYCTAIFDSESMDRMSAHLLNLINAICLSPGLPIGEISFLTEAENQCISIPDNRRIVSEMRQPVPFGTIGEIAFAGATQDDWRLTGDLGKQLPNGEIIYIGRKDAQVYINGYRVNCDEVAQALINAGAVHVAVIAIDRVDKGDKVLVAYLSGMTNATLAQVKRKLNDSVPIHLIPHYYITLDQLPLNATGQVDHKALPYPDWEKEKDSHRLPVGGTEEKMTAIWQEMLGVSNIGRNDNFFQLGGHSLKAVRILSSISRVWQASLQLRDIFLYPTIEEISRIVDQRAGSAEDSQIVPVALKEHYPASHAQKRLWVLSQLEEASIAYNMPYTLLVEGALDRLVLKRAIYTIMQRHEILRTVFGQVGEELRQFIHPEPFSVVEEHDLRLTNDPEAMGVILIKADGRRPFDLENGPLIRVLLIQVAEKKFIFRVNMHHIVSDGWSMEIFGNELFTLYNAYARGLQDPLPPLAIQYKDYSEWQYQQLQGEHILRHQQYLHTNLAGRLPVLQMPADKRRPPVKTNTGHTTRFFFTPEQTAGLRRFGEESGTSLFVVLLSILKTLFYRYTSQQDIILGIATAGRMQKELESQIGFYINTLVLRTAIEEGLTYLELQQRISDNMLEAMDHQVYPFDRLVEELNIARDTSRSAIFDVLVEFQNFENDISRIGNAKGLSDLTISSLDITNETSLFDFVFFFALHNDRLECNINYNTDIYSLERIQTLSSHFLQLASDILVDPSLSLEQYQLIPALEQARTIPREEERQALLTRLDRTNVAYPRDMTVMMLLEAQVERWPGNIAVKCGQEEMTYEQLYAHCLRLSQWLRYRGVRRGDIVGLLTERSINTILGMLSILHAGAAYLPLDPDYPEERTRYQIADSGMQILLTTRALLDGREYPVEAVFIEDAPEQTDGGYRNEEQSDPSDGCYVIYTSGTTGRPKGVMVEHRQVVRLLFNEEFPFDFGPQDVWTMFHSPCFDFSVWEIYGALLYGGKVIIIPRMTAQDPALYLSILASEKVSVINQTPSAFYQLAQQDAETPAELSSLRYVIFGGEALTPARLKLWHKLHPGVRLINMFGITETTVHVTYKEIGEEEIAGGISNIGRPLPTLSVYVLDDDQEPVALGSVGELYVGGAGVSRGYLGQTTLTHARFINNPFKSGDRLYRTGDLGRILPSWELEYLGRMDDQVQLRGFRIELGEIEARLCEYTGIHGAAVIAMGQDEDQSLVAYYVSEQETIPGDLRRYLATKLPDYMLPTWYMRMDRLPLNANGKLDRNALPVPEGSATGQYQAPQGTIETGLVDIWSELLKLDKDKISVTDSFFDLGGHSLKATLLISRIMKEWDIKIAFRQVFTTPSIRELATLIGTAEHAGYQDIFPAPLQTFYKASHPQKRLWVLSKLEMASLAFNLDWAYRFVGELDIEALRLAYRDIIHRHESLRTVFIDIEGEPHQVILPAGDARFTIGTIDLRDNPDKEQWVHKYKMAEITTPFDMEKGPLIRGMVLQTDPEVYFFLLTIHHIIADGWSLEILTRELLQLYTGHKNGGSTTLSPLKIQYKDFVYWLHNRLSGQHLDRLQRYWRNKLSGELPVLDLPSAGKRPAVQTYNGDQLLFRFSRQTTAGLNELATQHQVSLFIVIVSILKTVFYRYTDQTDLIVGTSTSGRLHKEVEDQIGLFLNTVALRTQFDDHDRFIDLLHRVRETVLDAFDHQEYPFDLLLEELAIRRDLSRSPVYDVLVLLQNIDVPGSQTERTASGKYKIDQLDNDNIASQGDLLFDFAEERSALQVSVLYNTDIFSQTDIQRLVAYFEWVAGHILANAQVLLQQIPLTLPEELTTLEQLTGPVLPIPDHPADILIEQMATRFPTHTAIVDTTGTHSYGDLNRAACRLARQLIDTLDSQQGSMVAVLLPRSARFVRTVLSIWKAGMAYIPLDPEWPLERIRHIIRDAALKAVIAESTWITGIRSGLQDLDCLLLDEGRLYEESQTLPDHALNIPRDLHDLAYVIYTSGSTGNPKGAMIEHLGMLNHLLSKITILEMTADSRVLQNARLTFDISIWQCFAALMTGGTTVIYPDEWIMDPQRFIKAVDVNKLTILEVVPSYLSVLLEECSGSAITWPSLRYLLVTGERITKELTITWFDQFPHIPMVNAYGPTEASDDITHHLMHAAPDQDFVPLGQVIPNMRMYIVNRQMQLCPPGTKGEICIAGPGVGRGYIGDEEKTNAVFMDDPFGDGRYGRLYKTGDIGRWHPDGMLEFLGREDDQVKLRGYRIELGGIEQVLTRYPELKACTVMVREDDNGNSLLVGYVVPQQSFDRLAISAWLKERLPDHMIPAIWVELDALPLTANGKLDRKRLPEPDLSRTQHKGYVAPRNAVERHLMLIWLSLLGAEQIGIDNNFFELGGNSIIIIHVLGKMRKLGLELQLPDFFFHQTIREQAELLRTRGFQLPAGETAEHQYVLSLNHHREGSPIYIIPGIGGTCDGYYEMADSFEAAFPVYGIQMQGLLDDGEPIDSIQGIAERNISLIRKSQPQGPYRFIGHSFGAVVVYEMVRQLEMQHETVELAVILDQPADALYKKVSPALLAEMIIDDVKQCLQLYKLMNKNYEKWLRKTELEMAGLPIPEMFPYLCKTIEEKFNNHRLVIPVLKYMKLLACNYLITYSPATVVSTELLVARAGDAIRDQYDETLGWSAYTEKISTITIPGDHDNMIRASNASVLAKYVINKFAKHVCNL